MFKNRWIILNLIFLAVVSAIMLISSQNKATAQSCETTHLPNSLVFIKRFENVDEANFDTEVKYDKHYHCTAFSWNARYDINEDNNEAISSVWTYQNSATKTWWAHVEMPSEGPHENPDVDIVCFANGVDGYDIVAENSDGGWGQDEPNHRPRP